MQSFVFLVNEDILRRSVRDEVRPICEEMVASGRVQSAEYWNATDAVQRARASLQYLLETTLQIYNTIRHTEYLKEFFEGLGEIRGVPVSVSQIELKRDEPCRVTDLREYEKFEPDMLFQFDRRIRWSLLTGLFGSGKTTLVSQALTSSSRTTIVLPCKELPSPLEGAINTKRFVRSIVDRHDPFSTSPELQDERYYLLAAEQLLHMLQEQHNGFVLVLDGLDEHHYYCTARGFAELSNHCKWFECPVVVTMRDEFISGTLGLFERPLRELADRAKLSRAARRIQLRSWSAEEIFRCVRTSIESARLSPEAERRTTNLESLHRALESGEAERLYGDLLGNPLMLRLLIEDVQDNGLRPLSSPEIVLHHMRRKVFRDSSVAMRITARSDLSQEQLADAVLLAIARVAFEMSETFEGLLTPMELIDLPHIQAVFDGSLGERASWEFVASHGFFVPSPSRRFGGSKWSFSLRAIQEYCLAFVCCGRRVDAVTVVPSVREIMVQVEATLSKDPTGPLAEFVASLA